jgi:1-acyl-sn-glycerol-3-phosphate acyltransferase
MFNKIRAGYRIFFGLIFIFVRVMHLVVLDKMDKLNDANRLIYRKSIAKGFAYILGFEITVKGQWPKNEAVIYIGNHRSTLDPMMGFVEIEAYPVSRAWVKNFPLFGTGSELTGIIFLNREDKKSRLRTRERILEELKKGRSIMLYPEGRTSLGLKTITFQKGAFDQAASGGFRIVPYILEYKDINDYWDHTESMVAHFFSHFGKRKHILHLEFGEPLSSDNAWTLLRSSQKWIDYKMEEVHRAWGNTHYDVDDSDAK